MAKQAYQQCKSIQISGSLVYQTICLKLLKSPWEEGMFKKKKKQHGYFLRGASSVDDQKNLVPYKLSIQHFKINAYVI